MLPPGMPRGGRYSESTEYMDEDHLVVVNRLEENDTGTNYVIVYDTATIEPVATLELLHHVELIACSRNWIAVRRPHARAWGIYDIEALEFVRDIVLDENEHFTALLDEGIVLSIHEEETDWGTEGYDMRIEDARDGRVLRQLYMADAACSLSDVEWPAQVHTFGEGREDIIMLGHTGEDSCLLVNGNADLCLLNDGVSEPRFFLQEFGERIMLLRLGWRQTPCAYRRGEGDMVWSYLVTSIFEIVPGQRCTGRCVASRFAIATKLAGVKSTWPQQP